VREEKGGRGRGWNGVKGEGNGIEWEKNKDREKLRENGME